MKRMEFLKIMKKAGRDSKVSKYWHILYPNLEEMETRGKEMLEDRYFIEEHLEEIEEKYSKAIEDGAQEESPQVLQYVIECLKREKAIEPKISAQKIGQATINVTTAAKKEAERVEYNKTIRDNIKEGEK